MQRFSSGGLGRSDDKWFSVGTLDVTTTTLVAGLAVLSFFVYAIEGASHFVTSGATFASNRVLVGQLWRIITWPLVDKPELWSIIGIAFFWMLSSQLERPLGKTRLAIFLALITIVPAVGASLYDGIGGQASLAFGASELALGVLVAFVAHVPHARFMFGIPGWVVAAVLPGIRALQLLGDGAFGMLVFLILLCGNALLMAKAFGIAEEVAWIPRVPLPVALTGDPYHQSARKRKRAEHLKIVRSQEELQDEIDQIEIDAILDQVSEGGMESLSKDQRKTLERYSKQQRKKKGL